MLIFDLYIPASNAKIQGWLENVNPSKSIKCIELNLEICAFNSFFYIITLVNQKKLRNCEEHNKALFSKIVEKI